MIKFENEAKIALTQGVNTLANAVKCTLGPSGRTVLISNNGKPYITKDGVTVANNIKLDDPFEQLGATVVKNVAKKTCDQCGDGTSTSCVLAQAIISEGLKTIKSGSNPVLIKRGMDQALQSVKVSIKNQSREIITHEDLVNVASISANNDREIGELIGEAMAAVKNQGIITVDPSDKTDTYVEKVDGLQFDQGYLSPYFINNRGKLNVIYNNPVVLIMKDKLKNMRDVIDTLSDVATQNQEILIITPDIDSEILQMFAANAAQGSLKCCIVKAPGFGEFQRQYIQDFMLFSCKEDKGLYYLGSADKVTVTKDSTTIINGHGDREALNNHLKLLKCQMINEGVEINKIKLKERLAKLQGGAAIIHVGGISEVEMLEKKDRIDDALNATRAALEEGVVIGGGYALLNSMEDVLNTDYETEDEKLGVDIILKAIQAPHREIYKNAGITPEEITTGKNNTLGYNLRSNAVQDFFEVGVIDPAKVTRVACENAVSVAGMFLTTECVIINEIEEK